MLLKITYLNIILLYASSLLVCNTILKATRKFHEKVSFKELTETCKVGSPPNGLKGLNNCVKYEWAVMELYIYIRPLKLQPPISRCQFCLDHGEHALNTYMYT